MTESSRPPATHKPTDKPLLPPRRPEYDYHWGRMLGAVLVLLVIGGMVLYGYQAVFSSSAREGRQLVEKPIQTESTVATQRAVVEQSLDGQGGEPAPITDIIPPAPESQDRVKPLLEETIMRADELPQNMAGIESSESTGFLSQAAPDSAADLAEMDAVDKAAVKPITDGLPESAALSIEPVPEPVADVAESDGVAEVSARPITNELPESAALSIEPMPEPVADLAEPETVQEATAEPIPIFNPEVEAETFEAIAAMPEDVAPEPLQAEGSRLEDTVSLPAADTTSGSFQLQDQKRIAPQVKRFLLASSISNREPMGDLSEIGFKADGSTLVWAFSEVINQRDRRIHYVWLHEGSQVARVTVNIRGDRWRSFSSKTITRSMQGTWRVELQDDEGRILASAEFIL